MHYNVINEVMSCKKSIMPTPGMMGTYFVGSDQYEVVCLQVVSPKKVIVALHGNYPKVTVNGIDYYDRSVDALLDKLTPKIDRYIAKYGDTDEAKRMYEFDLRHFNSEYIFSLRKNGRWLRQGSGAWSTGSIHWGHAEEYLDPSF